MQKCRGDATVVSQKGALMIMVLFNGFINHNPLTFGAVPTDIYFSDIYYIFFFFGATASVT